MHILISGHETMHEILAVARSKIDLPVRPFVAHCEEDAVSGQHPKRTLEPLGTRIIPLLPDASLFRQAVSSRSARRAATPVIWIAKNSVVLNEVHGLMRDGIKVIT